jgi:aspartyl-tRNA(Asn)/glutamyl-tRNA(Gln) amidotransferase subunit C
MEITSELFKHLLNLAKLSVGKEEEEKIKDELNKILAMAMKITTLDLQGVEPFKYTDIQKLIIREDVAGESLSPQEVLLNAKDVTFPFFKVPKVLR